MHYSKKLSRREFLKLTLAFPTAYFGTMLLRHESPQVASPLPNLLILVFDALSARHMSLYGYLRETTPNLERLAQRAIVYHTYYTTSNFTTPTTASMFTGVYPWHHGAVHLHGVMRAEFAERNLFALATRGFSRLGYSHNLLVTSLLVQMRRHLEAFMYTRDLALLDMQIADRLFQRDYNLAFWGESVLFRRWISKSSSLFFAPLYRLLEALGERRLESVYQQQFPLGIPYDNGVYFTLEEAIDFCASSLWEVPQPFLAYLHFLPPHAPYAPRQEFVGKFEDEYVPVPKPRHRFSEAGITKRFLRVQRQRYDEYIAYLDSEFGRLYDFLLNSGKLDRTVLVVTSDHGELFERNIWGHITRTLYEPLLRVPLLISLPAQQTRLDVHTPTSQVDLMPTLLHLMGQNKPPWCEGELLPPFGAPQDQRPLYAMVNRDAAQTNLLAKGTYALVRYPYKLIHYRGYVDYPGDHDELYQVEDDPEELQDRSQSDAALRRELRQELEAKLQEVSHSMNK